VDPSRGVATAFTFFRSMRASWHFGGATRSKDLELAVLGYKRALELLDHPRVDVDAPWCRSMIPFALAGYCVAARKLGRVDEALGVLGRWRPVYLQWLAGPLTDDERKAYDWLEEYGRPA
jgi:hypothetical protein